MASDPAWRSDLVAVAVVVVVAVAVVVAISGSGGGGADNWRLVAVSLVRRGECSLVAYCRLWG